LIPILPAGGQGWEEPAQLAVARSYKPLDESRLTRCMPPGHESHCSFEPGELACVTFACRFL
jgi:hypothetical protein